MRKLSEIKTVQINPALHAYQCIRQVRLSQSSSERPKLETNIPNQACTLFTMLLCFKFATFFAAFGISGTPVGLGFAVFSILYKPFSLLLSLPGLWLSRVHDFEADAFARSAMGSPTPLETALKRLSSDHLSHPAPHPLAVRLHYTHPPLLQRLAALQAGALS